MVNALASGTSGPGLSPDQGHCVVFLLLSGIPSRGSGNTP